MKLERQVGALRFREPAALSFVAELLTGAEELLVRRLRVEDFENVPLIPHLGLRLRLDDQHRLHRLMVAFAEVLLSLVRIVLHGLHRSDDFVGLVLPVFDALQKAVHAGIAERTVGRRTP